jgi:hypothetical protein
MADVETRRQALKESTVPILSHGLNESEQHLLRQWESDGRSSAMEKSVRLRFEAEANGKLKLAYRSNL